SVAVRGRVFLSGGGRHTSSYGDWSSDVCSSDLGLTPGDAAEVSCPWTFPDLESALTAMLSSGPAIKAIRTAGEAAARDAVTAARSEERRVGKECRDQVAAQRVKHSVVGEHHCAH